MGAYVRDVPDHLDGLDDGLGVVVADVAIKHDGEGVDAIGHVATIMRSDVQVKNIPLHPNALESLAPTPAESYEWDMGRKTPKPGRPKPRVLRDAAGEPVVGYVARELLLEENKEWVGKPVRYFCPAEHMLAEWKALPLGLPSPPSRVYLHKRARILFRGSRIWYEARDVFARPVDGMKPMPLMKALRNFSHDFFWVSGSGALERRATEYEARLPEDASPPRAGWKLMHTKDVASLIGYSKAVPAGTVFSGKSETDAEDHQKEVVRRRERALKKAVASLARHEETLRRKLAVVERAKTKIEKLRTKLNVAKHDVKR